MGVGMTQRPPETGVDPTRYRVGTSDPARGACAADTGTPRTGAAAHGQRGRHGRHGLRSLVVVGVVAALAACTSGSPGAGGSGAATGGPDGSTPAASTAGAGGSSGRGGETAESVTSLPGTPTAAQLATARAEVARLTLPRLAAQLVVPRQSGTRASAAGQLRQVGYGGFTVFRGNLPDGAAAVPAARADNAAFAAAVRDSGRSWPAFLAIDQEGGPVTRLDAPLTMFPAVMALGAAGDQRLARQVGGASGAELRGLGYTVVLAPDADVTVGAQDPTIGVRSPGSDPRAVSRIALGLTAGYLDAGLLPTLKHFPGHGSVTADTHVGTVRNTASIAALRARDLVPFADAAAAGAPAVMTAHIVLTALGDRPATVSAPTLTGLLRDDLGFRGLVVTDALEMQAVAGRYGAGQAAVEAVRAGADVLLMPADPRAAVDALVAAVGAGTLTRARLEESAARMVATLRAGVHAPPSPSAPGSHGDVARRLAAASITQLGGRCGARLVGAGIRVSGGTSADRSALAAAAEAAGLATGTGTSVVLRGGGTYRAAERAGESSGGAASGDVVVALDAPYVLARDSARVAKLATFGRTPATYAGLVQVLLGKQRAAGTLPVAVGGHAIGSGCGRSS